MNLTKAQKNMLERAERIDVLDSLWLRLTNSRPLAQSHRITSLHGSGDFRVAYRLKELGLGRIVCYAPIEGYFFKSEQRVTK
jgi:hypothetical protein